MREMDWRANSRENRKGKTGMKTTSEKINPALCSLATPIEALHVDPENIRKHDEASLSALVASLRRFGQQKPIIALRDGSIIAGNGLYTAAHRLGWKKIAVLYFDNADRTHAVAFALADNKTAELSDWNYGRLTAALGELAEADVEILADVGFSEEEIEVLLQAEWKPPQTTEDAPDSRTVAETGVTLCFSALQWEMIARKIERARARLGKKAGSARPASREQAVVFLLKQGGG